MPTDSNPNAIFPLDPQLLVLAMEKHLEMLIQIHQEGFDRSSGPSDLYSARLADCRPQFLLQLPSIAGWVRKHFLRCLGETLFLKADEDLDRFMETLKWALTPILPIPTVNYQDLFKDGSDGKVKGVITDQEKRRAYARFEVLKKELECAFARFRDWLALCDRSGASGTEEPVTTSPRRGTVAMAIGLLAGHPEWSNVRIAEEAGINPKTLSNSAKFKAARSAIKAAGASSYRQGKSGADTYEE